MSNVPKTPAENLIDELHKRATDTLTEVDDALSIKTINDRYREAEERLARQRQREIEERAFAAEAARAHEAIESEDAAERKRYAERQAEAEARVIANAALRVAKEKVEAARVKAHGNAIRDIVWYGTNASEHAASAFLEAQKVTVTELHEGRHWEEFDETARQATVDTLQKIEAAIARAYARRDAERIAEEAEARAQTANVAHRRAINREVVGNFVLAMSEVHSGNGEEAEKIATAIVTKIAKGEIFHVSISY
jgi:hypothetical protein